MQHAIVVVLDKSGSMEDGRDQTISAFNEFLREQQTESARLGDDRRLTLALFDAGWSAGQGTLGYAVAYDAVAVGDVPPLTREQYVPSGGTALCDAVARTVTLVEPGARDADKVVFVVVTDGEENSSRATSPAALRDLIARKEQAGWVFVYLGASADDFTDDQHLSQATLTGFDASRTVAFDKVGEVGAAMTRSTKAVSEFFAGKRTRERLFDDTEDDA